jgi:hypothetical protein
MVAISITITVSVAVPIVMPIKIAAPIKIIPVANYVAVAVPIISGEVPASRNPITIRHVAVCPNVAGARARRNIG